MTLNPIALYRQAQAAKARQAWQSAFTAAQAAKRRGDTRGYHDALHSLSKAQNARLRVGA